MDDVISIPSGFEQAAREIVAVCKKYGCQAAFCRIVPGMQIERQWRHDVVIEWRKGRHEIMENEIKVSAQIHLERRIDAAGRGEGGE